MDLKRLREARTEEMGFVQTLGVYRYVHRAAAMRESGGSAPVKVRWVDQDKGDRYRARLCAMEFRRRQEDTWFAGTPPHESLRILAGLLATPRKSRAGNCMCMTVLDVKRAFLHGVAPRAIYVELPGEQSENGKYVGRLSKTLYGTRDAPVAWFRAVQEDMGTMESWSAMSRRGCSYTRYARFAL